MTSCPACHRELAAPSEFCPHCGTALAASATPSERTTPGIAITGLVLAFIPLFFVNIVGAILGIVALNKINSQPKLYKGSGLAVTAIVVGFGWIVVGILAAIAIPNFLKYTARAKQGEAKASLRALYTTETAAFGGTGHYAATFGELGWEPDPKSRYTYCLGRDVAPARGAPQEACVGESYARENGFRIVAVANVDGDETRDVWAIDEKGELVNAVNDVSE